MKSLLWIVLLTASFAAAASVNCYTDAYGNTNCTGSGGYNSQTYSDDYGNSTGRDNQGNTWNCYSDDYGNTTCN
jgi:hypothetical protein